MKKLAIFGGQAIRKKSFASSVVIDKEERSNVLKVIRNKEFSRFMGSPSQDIDKQLTMTSREAVNYKSQYFTFLGGRMIRTFEADFAKKFGTTFAISVNSATSGLSTALGACGIGPGDEVITTCLSFNATALSILAFNAIPVFVDVNTENFCLDPGEVERKISKKTKAILVVHLLGNAADMEQIMKIAKKHRLAVIEDCAQAPGTRYKDKYVGTIGDIGVFSFQETKNITTGEGGMIITNNSKYAKKCRLIRNHGESIPDANTSKTDLVNNIGFNFRMTELTAAIGIGQLKKISENNRIRNQNARYLMKRLQGLSGLNIPEATLRRGTICHIFPLIYDSKITGVKREVVVDALKAEGIPVGTGYLRLMPENPIFLRKVSYGDKGCPFSCKFYNKKINYSAKDYPVASKLIYDRFIWFYHINRPNTTEDMEDVIKAFDKIFSNINSLRNYNRKKSETMYKW